ncbi:MAG: efflux transporter outer membrane subunit [Verrucomicrobiota bacterium]
MKTLRLIGLGLVWIISGCALGPDYERPDVYDVSEFRGETLNNGKIGWKIGEPSDSIAKGAWWEIFNQPQLNQLQQEARANNQSLAAALARIDSARARSRQSKADFFPELSANPSYSRSRRSTQTSGGVFGRNPSDEFRVPFDLSYEVDLWGRVRRTFEASQAEAEGSVADFENLLLSLQSELAQNYFSYQSLNAEVGILEETLRTRLERRDLIEKRVTIGSSSQLDLVRAESDLKTTEADLETIRLQRSQLQNVIATLLGQPASKFTMPSIGSELPEPPVIPVGLPSSLLERRPDVASAERTLAARNAEIGVAKASFFPVIRLTGQTGFAAEDIADLFTASGRIWSYGPSISLPIFQGSRLRAQLSSAESEYQAAVADYRQQILIAFQEVEDALVALESLNRRFVAEEAATLAAREAERLSTLRYESGVVDYIEALDAQRTALGLERTMIRTRGQKLVTAVALIEALGGGWD